MLVHVRVEHEARGRVQDDGLAERRAVPRQALERDRRLLVHERQRHELGEAAGVALQVADREHVARLVDRRLDVPEHDRRRRAQADARARCA